MSRQQTVRHTPVKLKTLIFNSLKTCVNVFVWTLGIRGWGWHVIWKITVGLGRKMRH